MDVFDKIGLETEEISGKFEFNEEGEVEVKGVDEKKELVYTITDSEREFAVRKKLVPLAYRNARFDDEKIRASLTEQAKRLRAKYQIFGYSEYFKTCSEILSSLRTHKQPRRSWIIGAPNGFGKTEFANECILTMMKNGWATVPYISLLELASIRAAEEQRLMRPFNSERITKVYVPERQEYLTEKEEYMYTNSVTPADIVKKPMLIESAYSLSEYLNAECLIVHFSGVESKEVESKMLMQLLAIRGPKGLPTIAMISTSLSQYVNDRALAKIIWDEILDYGTADCYNKVKHVSCYKQVSNGIDGRESNVDKDTGIVN